MQQGYQFKVILQCISRKFNYMMIQRKLIIGRYWRTVLRNVHKNQVVGSTLFLFFWGLERTVIYNQINLLEFIDCTAIFILHIFNYAYIVEIDVFSFVYIYISKNQLHHNVIWNSYELMYKYIVSDSK